MSLMSMTGFGHGHAQGGGLRVDVEISSVNRKQLDVHVNLPRSLQSLEQLLVEKVSHATSRGRVSVQVSVQYAESRSASPVKINHALIKTCLDELRTLADKFGVQRNISLGDVLRIPGALTIQEAEERVDLVKPVLEKALDKALKSFHAMRRKEGASLVNDLTSRLSSLAGVVAEIEQRAPALVENFRATLRDRINRLASELLIPDERLEKEVVLFADRSDITEEITRLNSHIKQGIGMLKEKEPAGRAMDFLAQEMFREINTIGSKAADARISSMVVTFKAELERFREQVQNIE
mgnify:CR=1 FL=1